IGGSGLACARSWCSVFACKRAGGTASHFDSMENFTVQLSGSKVWTISSDLSVKNPVHNYFCGATLVDPVSATYIPPGLTVDSFGSRHEVEMSPGSVLYHPCGSLHSTLAGSDSVSLNLCFEPVSMCDLIGGVLEAKLMAEPAVRGPLPIGQGESSLAELKDQLAEALRAAQRAFASLDPDDAAALVALPEDAEFNLLELADRCHQTIHPTTRLRANGITRFDRIGRELDTSVLPLFAYLGQPPKKIGLRLPFALEAACELVISQQGSWAPRDIARPLPEEHILIVSRALVEVGALRLSNM